MSNAGKAPSVADEMAKFSGFSTNNGITVKAEDTRTGPGETDLSDDERTAGIKVVGKEARATEGKEKATPAAAKVELSDAEADAALDAARGKLGEGEELTREEEDEILAAALTEKKSSSRGKPPEVNDRVKRAQEGRRRAEARAAAADKRATALEERLARLETGGAPLTPAKNAGKESKEPDPKAFELGELDPKYIRALVRWENEQADAERAQNQETRQRTSSQEKAAAEFAEKKAVFEDAGFDDYDDFQEVVLDTAELPKSDPASWPCSPTMSSLIFDSEVGHHVAYVLASDVKEARKIDKLTPAAQARWFFKQEAKFEAEKVEGGQADEQPGKEGASERREANTQQPRQVSKAPPPPQRNRGGSGNRQQSDSTTDFAAFEAMATASARPRR